MRTASFLIPLSLSVLALGAQVPAHAAQFIRPAIPKAQRGPNVVAPRIPSFAGEPTPLCYIQIGNRSMQSLDKLCGVGKKSNVIDLTVDLDRDGVPDQLLAEMKGFQAKMRTAKTPAEYDAYTQQLEARMPYSDNVRRLQAQQRELQQQMAAANGNYDSKLMNKYGEIQEQMMKDSSYRQVQEAMGKVYGKL
ncbi:MAG: hypothetical protein HC860_02075 [Alkalinema sp. RU_4_3]|nr:hypothetical protein [Alkalinema sp. RU_4_3]